MHTKFLEDILDVILDGARAERETPRDLLIREALAHQPDDLLLALR